MAQKNVLGTPLVTCSTDPLTGYLRDGYCCQAPFDHGMHTVCAVMTEEFLKFTASRGNDLTTPRPEFRFPGLKPGDRWCICLMRWIEALEAKVAPPIILEATHLSVTEFVDLEILKQYAHQSPSA
ncbi:MAG: DUF2237 domain-containing protein [Methylacidiphilales bacterium]|nr:DUF2237 domain-containing protein [Candidatus Methylacidiphilales bacterium]MDW8348999.1 DUF2237 domain-containing protein [Verrucomicrobiae bacterium]